MFPKKLGTCGPITDDKSLNMADGIAVKGDKFILGTCGPINAVALVIGDVGICVNVFIGTCGPMMFEMFSLGAE